MQVGENQVIVTELRGEVIAFDNMCTHEECDLFYGAVDEDDEIECDCHGTRFNVLTGAVTAPPAEIPPPHLRGERGGRRRLGRPAQELASAPAQRSRPGGRQVLSSNARWLAPEAPD